MGKRVARCLVAVVCAVCVAALAGCAGSLGNNEDSGAQPSLPELRIGVDTLEPFFFVGDDGEYQGIDADIAREACERAGYTPVFVPIKWSERDDELASGDIDCLWSAFAKNGREDNYLWTASYVDSDLGILVSSRTPSTSLDDFRGPGGLAVRANSVAEKRALEIAASPDYPLEFVRSYESYSMAQTAFVKAYADGLVGHVSVLKHMMDEYPGQYRILDPCIETLHIAVAFEKDGPMREHDAIDDALASMKADGTVASILECYDFEDSGVQEATSNE